MARIKKKLRGEGSRPTTRSRGTSYMEVVVKLYQNGIEDIKSDFEGGETSKNSLKNALAYLEKQSTRPDTFGEFKDFVESMKQEGSRGKAPAQIGETRSYKAQKLKDGSPFLRLPLDFLGTKKGELVYVTFKSDTTLIVSSVSK